MSKIQSLLSLPFLFPLNHCYFITSLNGERIKKVKVKLVEN